MLKKLYQKSNVWFAVVWIIAYCVLMSAGDALSEKIDTEKAITLPVAILLSVLLFVFLKKNRLLKEYGLCLPKRSAGRMLYYLPVVLMLTANLWFGVGFHCGALETVLYILTMFGVGFLEEVIFRGLLFNAMKKDNLIAAIIVSSVTFGVGHIVNSINGSGADLVSNLLQIVYATAAGFMFVMIYYKSQSLVICIVAHGLFNAISVFANDDLTVKQEILSCILLTLITGGYAAYLALSGKKKENGKRNLPQS